MSEQSENVGELAKALATAQGEMEGAKKHNINPAFRSKYADLASVWDACRDALSKNGLAVTQTMQRIESGVPGVCVATTLLHSSGEWMRGHTFIPTAKQDAHGYGSAITYARRFSLAAIVGIAPEDDDGNGAALPTPQRGPIKSPTDLTPTHQQPSEQLPQQLGASVDLMERAVDANEMLASAKTMGELNEAWLFVGSLRKQGLPTKHLDSLKALKDKRKGELSPAAGAAAE